MTKSDGLRAAILRIEAMIKDARKARHPFAKRHGKTIEYYDGLFEGLVTARAMLTLAEYPDANEKEIKVILRATQRLFLLSNIATGSKLYLD